MTDKLYYTDAYMKDFTARVLECEAYEGRYAVVLDRTAFFPEEGGQSADGGVIAGIPVLDVKEKSGVIYHYTESPLEVGAVVSCEIYFPERFDKMQQHTAEHILSGIICKLYGYNNVGFHLGCDEVTFDIDGVLSREELLEVERLANKAVFDNLRVNAYFPDRDELSLLTYRSKLDITDGVRIVDIDGVDSCACCAPHVAYTGEIGCIKILDFIKWRGGLRMNIAAGARALMDYIERSASVKNISTLLSAPKSDVYAATLQLKSAYEAEKSKNRELMITLASLRAEVLESTDGNHVELLSDMPMDSLIAFSNAALPKVGGILVALTGTDNDYKYVISSNSRDLSGEVKKINSALCGKGGGRSGMIQGSFSCELSVIREYFK